MFQSTSTMGLTMFIISKIPKMVYNQKLLAALYGVSRNTLKCWLKKIPNLEIKGQRLLTPLQVEIIFEALGNPSTVKKHH